MMKRDQLLNRVILLLAALLVLLVAGILVLRSCRAQAPAPPVPETPVEDAWALLPRSRLDPDLFSADDRGRISYDAPDVLCGVDVSRWQGEIDWAAVAGDGVDFAILQLGYRGYSEGLLSEDGFFEANLAGAQAAGLPVGVYFFSQAISETEAEEEAAFVLDVLGDTVPELPVFFDWEPVEYPEARTHGVTGGEMTAFANVFCARIRSAGLETGIYFNRRQGYIQYDLTQLAEHRFWLAEYRDTPAFAYAFHLWQYTDQGQVAGIDGPVDLNLWFPEN